MRRHALRAYDSGDQPNASYLAISEDIVAVEGYEALIAEAVDETLEEVAPQTRAVFLALFCIDDLLGTDEVALVEGLSKAHPAVSFVVDRTHPIASSSKSGMGEKKQVNLYGFLRPALPEQRDDGINLVGNFVPLPQESEFFDVLKSWGVGPVRQLIDCSTYEEYEKLACSRANIVLRAQGLSAACDMRDRLGIQYMMMAPSYRCEKVEQDYRGLAELLQVDRPDLAKYRERATAATERACAALAGRVLAIDCKATLNPHSMALALLEAGFDVRYVFRSKHLFDTDSDDARTLAEHYPDVQIIRSDDPMLRSSSSPIQLDCDVVTIGVDAARTFASNCCVNMWHDEGFFGYQGITRLMDMLAEAVQGGNR